MLLSWTGRVVEPITTWQTLPSPSWDIQVIASINVTKMSRVKQIILPRDIKSESQVTQSQGSITGFRRVWHWISFNLKLNKHILFRQKCASIHTTWWQPCSCNHGNVPNSVKWARNVSEISKWLVQLLRSCSVKRTLQENRTAEIPLHKQKNKNKNNKTNNSSNYYIVSHCPLALTPYRPEHKKGIILANGSFLPKNWRPSLEWERARARKRERV